MKQIPYTTPMPGTYCLARGIRINGEYAICDYPLRAIRLNTTARQLLLLCTSESTCHELAGRIDLPVKRVEALCQQLHWKGLLEAGPHPPPETWPHVSVIIPSYNRAGQLERCLRSLLAIEYPASCLEIIVVDDGSTDRTSTLLEQLKPEFTNRGSRLHVVRHTQQQGVARSRNSGAEAAQSELLAYIDSDCVASPGWLVELVPAFQDVSIAAVGGMIRAYESKSMLGRYEDVRSSLFMGVRPQQVRLEGPLTYLPTANLVVRRDLWQRIGGFGSFTFGEDVDLCRRLLATGSRLLYLPRGVVYHDYRTQMKAFLQIHASYASSEAALLQQHPDERRILVLPPEQATFAGLLLGALWAMTLGMIKHFPKLTRQYRPRRSRRGRFIAPTADLSARERNPHPGRCKHPLPTSTTTPAPTGRPHVQGTREGPLARIGFLGKRHHARRGGGYGDAGWGPLWSPALGVSRQVPPPRTERPVHAATFLALTLAILLTLLGTRNRVKKVREHQLPISPLTILQATLRGHLAYTYHLCRHLTRYYTLPLLIAGILLPPLLILTILLCGIVIGVDYTRLRPDMSLGRYALCSVLDDCAYEVGVLIGCIHQKTWKPLVPVIKRKNPTR